MIGVRDRRRSIRCERRDPTRRRRTVRAAALAGALVVLVGRGAAALEPLPEATYQQWIGGLESHSLDDGSVLSEYVVRTPALEVSGVTLSIAFVPRFGCSPLLGVRVTGDPSASLGAALGDGDRVALAVDGTASELAVMVDVDERARRLWFDGDAEFRKRLRRSLDDGSKAELALPDEETVTFSLLGSRRSASVSEAACRAHEPLPYEGDREGG